MHIYQIACCKSQLLLFGELVGNAFDSFCNFQHFEGMDFSWTLQIISFCVLTILRGLLKTKVEFAMFFNVHQNPDFLRHNFVFDGRGRVGGAGNNVPKSGRSDLRWTCIVPNTLL